MWDPLLIVAQIVSLQCLYYLSLGVMVLAMLGPTTAAGPGGDAGPGRPVTVFVLFDPRALSLQTAEGKVRAAGADALPGEGLSVRQRWGD